jgi:hypothetical protein
MSKIRRPFVALLAAVAIVVIATAVVVVANPSHHRHAPATAVVHVVTPEAAASPTQPGADFEADAFLNLLTRVDPAIANQLVNALSPADRVALVTQVQISTGLAAG